MAVGGMLGVVCGSGDSGCCLQVCCRGSSSVMGIVEEEVSLTRLPWLDSAGLQIRIAAAVVVEKACARHGKGGDGSRWHTVRCVWYGRLWLLLSRVLSWQQVRDGHS